MREIDHETWRTISPLLDQALEMPAAARREFVLSLQANAPHVADLLGSLLAAHESVLHSPFLESLPTPTAAPIRGLAGSTIGAYTLDELIGSGAMGAVWRAHRSDGRFEGSAAVKLLHLAVLDEHATNRFAREGTLLARLSHPNIARLFDAGVTTSGQPYLVLEYVQGRRIDQFADEHRLDLPERLELFLQVADAVAHAHAHLIVHRDLKAANILVTDQGTVKLLDFGIARLVATDEPLAEVTLTGHRALTPEAAAPEQVLGESVTTATDVYALGVLLYRLLAGGHPTGSGCTTVAEHLRAIAEKTATLASATLPQDEIQAAAIAAARRTTPDGLRRVLKADLDTILSMAVNKEVERRYRSVGDLADDVRRYLRHEPVRAEADRWSYRAGKFARRHAAALAVAAVVFAALTAATVVTTTQMLEARRQRDQAEFQARRAEASSEFMRYLVTQIGAKPMTMREILDKGRQALEQQYGADPAFRARMLMQLSGPYLDLGDYKMSAVMMAQALEIATSLDDPALLSSAHCGTGTDLVEQRDFEGARKHLDEGRRQALRLADPSRSAGECATGETRLALAESRFDAAIEHATRAVEFQEQKGGPPTTTLTAALNNLGAAYSGAGRLLEALSASQRTSEIYERIGRARTSSAMVTIQNRANLLRRLGRWLEADRTYNEAASLASSLHPERLVPAYLLTNQSWVAALLARGDEALALLNRARAQSDLTSAFAAVGRLVEGIVLVERGEIARARALHESLKDERTAVFSPHVPTLRLLEGKIAAADRRLADARTIVANVIKDEGYPERLTVRLPEMLDYSAQLAVEAGDLDTAVHASREAVRIADLVLGTESPSAYAGHARLTLGEVLTKKADAPAARSEFERAVALLEAAAGPSHPWTLEAGSRLAR